MLFIAFETAPPLSFQEPSKHFCGWIFSFMRFLFTIAPHEKAAILIVNYFLTFFKVILRRHSK